MITVDLITGFLGAGKTTFIKRYVRYLMDNGLRVCILENDYGAVNVDTMFLQKLHDDGCGIEMVSGACDKDCHKRRFKTKLIAMAMMGYERVVIEPSGVFDVDEFFDTLREAPLDRWYTQGSVIAIVDPSACIELTDHADFLLASQAAVAGTIVFSRCDDEREENVLAALDHIDAAMKKIGCHRDPRTYFLARSWDSLTSDDFTKISGSGSFSADFIKICDDDSTFGSVYFMNIDPPVKALCDITRQLFEDPSCGKVQRVKGFTFSEGAWYEINAVNSNINVDQIAEGQSVIIVIGEKLNKSKISKYFNTFEN